MITMNQPEYLIIGAGYAGAVAAQTLREEGFDGRVTLIGAESHRPYHRPPLSKEYLQGKADRDSVFVHPESWYSDNAVDLLVDNRVASVDPRGHRVRLADGAERAYDKLLIATGSTPRRLDVDGATLSGVHYLRTLDDSEALRTAFSVAERAVIIGAGWIGLEAAAAARQAGLEVTVLEAAELPLLRALGPEAARMFADLHRDHG